MGFGMMYLHMHNGEQVVYEDVCSFWLPECPACGLPHTCGIGCDGIEEENPNIVLGAN
jgi:hypothetical protein